MMNFLSRLTWRFAALKNGFRDATVYRTEFFLEIIGSALVPAAIQLVLWHALFQTSGTSTIRGMTYLELIQYTCVSVLFSQVRGGDHDFELQDMIRTGQLSNFLLRPVGVVEFTYIRGVAPRLFIAFLCLCLGMGAIGLLNFFKLFPEITHNLSPLRLIGATGMALIGNIIHYQIGAILATTAFFWEEAYSVLMVKNMLVNLLSGELIPLNLFPPSFQWIWKSTPFYFYVYGPTQYALGHWSTPQFLEQLGLCLFWMMGATVFIHLSWKLGIKKYLSLGG